MPENHEEMLSREEALNQREAELNRRELKQLAMDELRTKKLAPEIAEALDYTDESAMRASLERLEGIVQAAVQAGVDERLRGHSPTAVRRPPVQSASSLEQKVREAMKID